jgi:hypothetical protein
VRDEKNEILAREIAKAGALGGAIGGGLVGALGGAWGAKTVARHLPDNIGELTIEISAPPEEVLETAFNILNQQGRLIEDPEPPTALPTICALVGSGFFNLNQTLVKIQVDSVVNGASKVSIRGMAKEGLIKQKAGEKAVKRISELLTKAFSPESGESSP